MRAFLRAALAALLLLAPAAAAQVASEASVKAAFLFRFASYVDWPGAGAPPGDGAFVFGVAGNGEVAAELEKIVAGRTVHNRRAEVRRVADPAAVRGVHVLFIGREASAAPLVREALARGALAVTEGERGLEAGSAINFVTAENRVGFEVSLDAADKGGHRISSRMLAVAKRVVPRT